VGGAFKLVLSWKSNL